MNGHLIQQTRYLLLPLRLVYVPTMKMIDKNTVTPTYRVTQHKELKGHYKILKQNQICSPFNPGSSDLLTAFSSCVGGGTGRQIELAAERLPLSSVGNDGVSSGLVGDLDSS